MKICIFLVDQCNSLILGMQYFKFIYICLLVESFLDSFLVLHLAYHANMTVCVAGKGGSGESGSRVLS